jgi:transcriptional regulator with XRE-family HTH domain
VGLPRRADTIGGGRIGEIWLIQKAQTLPGQYPNTIAPWTEVEIDYLRERCEAMPHNQIIYGFRRKAKDSGWPKRSHTAVEVRLKRLQRDENLQRKCTLNNWTIRELARCLGLSHTRVRSWCRIGGLPCRKIARNQNAVLRADLKRWLMDHPGKGADIERYLLEAVLDDKKAVDFILSHEPDARGYSRPVICLDNGMRFNSAKAASRASYASPGRVATACRTGGKAAGKRWAWAG